MRNSNRWNVLLPAFGAALILGLASCGGGSRSPSSAANAGGKRAQLKSISYGRLVDVYAYRRVDPSRASRIDGLNRKPVLIQREILINPDLRSDDLFQNTSAQYRFLPYDAKIGHRELLILWDDTNATEAPLFKRALEDAQLGLKSLGAFYAFNPSTTLPAPVVPNDAAFLLTFDRPLGLDSSYFDATPTAVQVLQLAGNPELVVPSQAYSPVVVRVISRESGKQLIIDPEISGNEAKNRTPNPNGLPQSLDNLSANIRIALPTAGVVANTFKVGADPIGNLNSVDVRGNAAVIRDFRVANRQDADYGALPGVDLPEVAAYKVMGILAVDKKKRTITVNKRFADLVIRGRYPFVDGPLDRTSGLPLGPRSVPQSDALQNGDMIFQDVRQPNGEVVRIRAEVLQNMDIASYDGDLDLGQGGGNPTVELKVSAISAFDSLGNEVFFQASTLPLGADCEVKVHYHYSIKIDSKTDVGDGSTARAAEFLIFDPAPPRIDPVTRRVLKANEWVDPLASVAVRFSKPMAIDSVKPEDNIVVANKYAPEIKWIDHVKIGNLTVVPSDISDLANDGTGVRLSMPLGVYHAKGQTEKYYVHLRDHAKGARDRAGQTLELSSGQQDPFAVTFDYTLRSDADSNYIGSVLRRFNSPDEDGTDDQATLIDYFGQFQQNDGKLFGVPTVRFSRVADRTTLPLIRPTRDFSQECTNASGKKVNVCPTGLPPFPLYQTVANLINLPPVEGGISEPHIAEGCRLQMTYREDDFNLSHLQSTDFEIDVEQLHWAPFIARVPSLLTFDSFDRYTLVLSTSEKRPDKRPIVITQGPNECCATDGASFNSGLTDTFENNYLDHAARVEVVKDKVYTINPNNAFKSSTNETFIGYPKFSKTYTWRDRRYVGWDGTKPTGLGGSQKPNDPSAPDRTKDITSPWFPEFNPDRDGYNAKQSGDFDGSKAQDHHPYALPLLADFQVFADDTANGKVKGDNLFMIGYVGVIYPNPGHGFYNRGYPWFRVHSSGGIDTQSKLHTVDAKNVKKATGGWLTNAVLGTFQAPPGDDHIHWAQADFVRKLSVVTFGYVDLLRPAMNEVKTAVGWPGGGDRTGFPDLSKLSGMMPAEFAVVMRPRPEDLPQGTKVVVEFRGAQSFDNDDKIYNKVTLSAGTKAKDINNLLNPNYACEQYRYAGSGRINASGLTNYVEKPEQLVNKVSGQAPRFVNWRLTFLNNTSVTPALVPYVDSFALVYRVKPPIK